MQPNELTFLYPTNDHNKSTWHLSSCIVIIFLIVMKTVNICYLMNFQICDICGGCTHNAQIYTGQCSEGYMEPCTWKKKRFLPLNHLSPCHPIPYCALQHHGIYFATKILLLLTSFSCFLSFSLLPPRLPLEITNSFSVWLNVKCVFKLSHAVMVCYTAVKLVAESY